jgi:hypothetical protein
MPVATMIAPRYCCTLYRTCSPHQHHMHIQAGAAELARMLLTQTRGEAWADGWSAVLVVDTHPG